MNSSGKALLVPTLIGAALLASCATQDASPTLVGDALSEARASDGAYISWVEHVIDDPASSGLVLTGGDGLIMVDLDGDGRDDIVSVHESDVQYDGTPDGFIRAAFAGADPDEWINVTLASDERAGAPEDVAAADFSGDGRLDLVVASELGHVLYLQNPGENARAGEWPYLILPMTAEDGSYIRVFAADLDGDGRPEAIGANKGEQNITDNAPPPRPVSMFSVEGDPLDGANWTETVLGEFRAPRQASPIDIDQDGDLDVIAGSSVETRLFVIENVDPAARGFEVIPIAIEGARTEGFNVDFADLNVDGRTDIVTTSDIGLVWLEQPDALNGVWRAHRIGTIVPDFMVGLALADIDGDGDLDVMTGAYSLVDRERDDPDATVDDALGRLAWFANPGDPTAAWTRHDISRRLRGMFDKFVPVDLNGDGEIDFAGTRGNSNTFDGVFWLEQIRTAAPSDVFIPARPSESAEMPLPETADE